MPKHSFVTASDMFCGAGGSSIGAVAAGAELKLALNHWDLAIRTHNTNFPDADHDCTDVSASNPRRYQSTDVLIASPECTNHSLAKGQKRKAQRQMELFGKVELDASEERSRATMWDVPRFAEYHRYNVIIVENVVDVGHWVMWDAWLHAMHLLGYDHRCVYYNSMHAHPTPQSRDRVYIVFWRKGNRAPNLDIRPAAYCTRCERNVEAVQSWKNPGKPWGRYRKQYNYCCPVCASVVEPYYYCAANAIDWSLAAERIGDRKKPLKEKTLNRIRAGLEKFASRAFLADMIHTARQDRHEDMVWPLHAPGRTQIGQASHGLVVPPFLVDTAYSGDSGDRATPSTGPLPTQTTRQTMGMVMPPFIVELYGQSTVQPMDRPLGAVLGNVHHGVCVPPFLVDLRGENAPKTMEEALSTVCASGNHHGVAIPFLTSYYGTDNNAQVDHPVPTVTATDRHALVIPPFILSYYTRPTGKQAALASIDEALPTQPTWPVHYLAQPGETPSVEECGFRMLQPHEIHRAMAFPEDYVIHGTNREKVKQLGNAVTPPVMSVLLQRCIDTLRQ